MHTTKITLLCAALVLAVGVSAHAATPSAPPDPVAHPPVTAPTSTIATATPTPTPVSSASAQVTSVLNTSVGGDDQTYLHQRDDLIEQVNLMKLRVELKGLHDKLDKNGSTQSFSPPSSPPPSSLISEPPRSMSQGSTVSVPMVTKLPTPVRAAPTLQLTSVVNIGGARQAVIRDGNGAYPASVGTRLPSGWTVASLGSTTATLRKGRAVRHLSIGD